MRLTRGQHLAFCPDAPCRGSWAKTFEIFSRWVLAVRAAVRPPGERFGIGMRLGEQGAREPGKHGVLSRFQTWLREECCAVLTINDPSAGEGISSLDWTRHKRIAYTRRLLDLLGELLPESLVGNISTAPGPCRGTRS